MTVDAGEGSDGESLAIPSEPAVVVEPSATVTPSEVGEERLGEATSGVSPMATEATRQMVDLGEFASGRITVEEYISRVWAAVHPDDPTDP